MDDKRRSYLLKLALAKNVRRAMHAIAELRAAKVTADALAQPARADEQRAFQYRVARAVLQAGVAGLVEGWSTLGEPKWRAALIQEMGPLFDEPAVIDLGIAALEDPVKEVRVRAVWMLQFIGEPESYLRKSASGRRYLKTAEELRAAVAPAHRSRITRALVALLADPQPVLAQIVDLLGYTAHREDRAALEALLALRVRAGEPHTVSYERVEKKDFAWYEKLALQKKGDDPAEMVRILYTPTGLLDAKRLEASIARIRQRAP